MREKGHEVEVVHKPIEQYNKNRMKEIVKILRTKEESPEREALEWEYQKLFRDEVPGKESISMKIARQNPTGRIFAMHSTQLPRHPTFQTASLKGKASLVTKRLQQMLKKDQQIVTNERFNEIKSAAKISHKLMEPAYFIKNGQQNHVVVELVSPGKEIRLPGKSKDAPQKNACFLCNTKAFSQKHRELLAKYIAEGIHRTAQE